ncbi:MAG: hypothetical protein HY042_07435 [Spirochaetia bacterium]|nr:hypothetical protein [Spirochaetia bacterium]
MQRQLRVILRHKDERAALSHTLSHAYRRLGDPQKILDRLDCRSPFNRLLDSFGVLTVEHLTSEETDKLAKIPYVIWPDERHCMVAGEVVDMLAEDENVMREGYLFAHLASLSAKELNAWCRWIGSSEPMSTERERVKLYTHIAWLRYADEKQPDGPAIHESFLEDVIPDDPAVSPVSWYYRGILPLYEALGQTEQSGVTDPRIRSIVSLFKTGKLAAYAEPAGFGLPVRHRLVRTREGLSLRPPVVACSLGEFKEGLLF